jgi:hypothetical protein
MQRPSPGLSKDGHQGGCGYDGGNAFSVCFAINSTE